MSAARRVVGGALATCLLGGCSGTAEPTGGRPPTSPPVRAISLIVGAGDTPYTRAVVAGARAEAARRNVPLQLYAVRDKVGQRRRLFEAIERPDRAVIVAPLDYLDAYLLLRTAHDREVPTFVLDLEPPPATNQAYVWSFLSGGRKEAAVQASRALAARVRPSTRSLLVVSSDALMPGTADAAQAELRRLRPGVDVRREVVAPDDAGGAGRLAALVDRRAVGGVIATDENAAEALIAAAARIPGLPVVAVGASTGELAALRSGKIAVLAAPRPAELGRRAVEFAAASAARQPERMPRTVQLDVVVLTRADLGTAKEIQAAYPP